MEKLIGENLKIDFIESKNSYFGCLEEDGLAIIIYVEEDEVYCDVKISKIIVEEIVKYFLEYQNFSLSYLKLLNKQIVVLINEYKKKDIELENYNLKLAIVLTNGIEAMVSSTGDFKIIQKDQDEKIKIESKNSDNDHLGGQEMAYLELLGPLELEKNDTLEILSKNNLKLSTITFQNIKQATAKTINKKLTQKVKIIIFVFLFLIIYMTVNFVRITKYEGRIAKSQKSLTINIKNQNVQNIKEDLEVLENLYTNLNKEKFLIISKNKKKKISKESEQIKIIKEELKLLESIKVNMLKAKTYTKKLEYETALRIYNNLLNISTSKIDLSMLKEEIKEERNKLNEILTVKTNENKIKEFLENEEYKKVIETYENIKEIYKKQNMLDKVSEINEIIIKYEEKIEGIENTIETLKLKLDDEQDKVKKTNIFLELLKCYKMLSDEENIQKISNNIKVFEENILLEKERALELREEALAYMELKNYSNALECLLESNKIFKKCRLEKEIYENKKYIRKIKKLSKESISKIKNSNKTPIYKKEDVITSINLSIKKGDEFMKENKWDLAIIEYNRALEFSKKVNISNESLEKLNKKLTYAIKKSKGNWFKIWN